MRGHVQLHLHTSVSPENPTHQRHLLEMWFNSCSNVVFSKVCLILLVVRLRSSLDAATDRHGVRVLFAFD